MKSINESIELNGLATQDSQTDSADASYKTLDELVSATADNIFIRVPTDAEVQAMNTTKSGIIIGYKGAKQEMYYDVLAVGPSVARCKVGDKIMIEAHKLQNAIARTVDKYVFIVVRDFDVLGIIK